MRNALVVAAVVLGCVPAQARAEHVSGSVADVVAAAMPAVVNLSLTKALPPAPADPSRSGHAGARRTTVIGSGFVIDAEGHVLTNRHVVEGASRIMATFQDGSVLAAQVLAASSTSDVALLQVRSPKPLPFLKLADSDALRVGDPVLAMGNPLGLGGSVSAGIVSGLNRDIRASQFDEFIQTDAAINHGNSGGPLVSMSGEAVGIDTAIYSPTAEGGSIGIGFAIPAESARFVVGQLLQYGRMRLGWLGVQMQPVTADVAEALGMEHPEGTLVVGVESGSPAAKTGLRPEDVILGFGGAEAKEPRALARMVGRAAIGSSSTLSVWRDGSQVELSFAVQENPGVPAFVVAAANSPPAGLGLKLATNRPPYRGSQAADASAVVAAVDADGHAAAAGLVSGDSILQVGQERTSSAGEVMGALRQARASGRTHAMLLVRSGGRLSWVPLPLAGVP